MGKVLWMAIGEVLWMALAVLRMAMSKVLWMAMGRLQPTRVCHPLQRVGAGLQHTPFFSHLFSAGFSRAWSDARFKPRAAMVDGQADEVLRQCSIPGNGAPALIALAREASPAEAG